MAKQNGSYNPWNKKGFVNLRKKAIPYVTGIAHASAPFISTFLLVHLSAPILANVGGSSLASQTMILGREYYQTSFGEKYLLLGPLTVHALSGLTKRLITPRRTKTSSDINVPYQRPLSSLISVTGYTVAFVLLPIHYLTHRVYPTSPSPEILSLGPSELDYEFVKVGLRHWPWRNWILYTGLVAFTVLHTVDGVGIIWNTWFRGSKWFSGKKTGGGYMEEDVKAEKKSALEKVMTNKKWRLRLGLVGLVLPTLMGVWWMSREPMYTFASNAKRCQNVFRSLWIYRI
ncbi:hypothetical protein AX16_002886 [Volvariella volvacea WC 439]|nr:hypothetical protein AX16_002886 [Volvariella volvacea WC 439]